MASLDYISEQPKAIARPNLEITPVAEDDFDGEDDGKVKMPTFASMKRKVTTKEGWLGDYDFKALCMPQIPWSFRRNSKKRNRPSPFYALDAPMPILLAMICGFQHCLAMIGGLITPPIIFSSQLGFDSATTNQAVAVSLMASGFLSILQLSRFPIPFTKRKYWVGSGLLCVLGTSFATLSTASSIFSALYADGTCPSTLVDGLVVRQACPQAYGYLLGTSCLCSLVTMGMAFAPPKVLKRIFPPIVTGTVVLLIGASLVGKSGALNWMGGTNNCRSRPETGLFRLCPTINGAHPLPWGSAEYFGLGFLSFFTIILVEFVGSPAMKSASIVMGLLVGCIVAGPAGYISNSTVTSAPAITFLWRETFPLKIYGPAVLPMIAVYLSLAMECTGDITASSEASRQPVTGKLHDSRVQGGLLSDGLAGLFSGLMMNAPVSTFAQNNGVISVTRCANRFAGYFCCLFLILFGILAKLSGVFLAIPNSVLGGVTTFLFASVAVSGLKIISRCGFTRRDRIILAGALSLGFANLLVSDWASHIFTYSGSNAALKGFINSIVIVLSTPFLIGGLVASLLNATLPAEPEEDVEDQERVDEDLDSVEMGAGGRMKATSADVEEARRRSFANENSDDGKAV
ncbi:hypothetical protein JCM8547_003011 [Rhodosporidiobolus lusitaniae]